MATAAPTAKKPAAKKAAAPKAAVPKATAPLQTSNNVGAISQVIGAVVDLAVDGIDGWNTIRTGQYDLVVSDIDMPRMTGLEFVKAIRADPKVKSIPVVIVSYKDRDEDRSKGLDVGANYYLTKSSFHDGQFLKAIEDLIGGPET